MSHAPNTIRPILGIPNIRNRSNPSSLSSSPSGSPLLLVNIDPNMDTVHRPPGTKTSNPMMNSATFTRLCGGLLC